jgi:hypothetical protein
MGVILPDDQIEAILLEAERVLAAHETPDKEMSFPISAHRLIG